MSNKLIILLISMVTFVSAFGKGAETDGGVLVLNEKNILVETLNRPWILIEFYAPWCGHCQKMEPVYSQAAKMLQLHSPMLHVGKINVDENKQLKEMYQIQKFPTFVIFKNGNYLEHYDGERTARAIYNAVVKNNKAEKQVTDCKVITKMKKQSNQFTFVYFGPEDHPFYKGIYLPFVEQTMNNQNNNLKRVQVRHSDDESCATEMMVNFPSIMLYKDFETPEKLQQYSGDEEPTLENFEKWRFQHMAPNPAPLMQHSDVTMGSGYPVIILFRSDASKDDDFSSEFTEAALEFNGQAQVYFTETNLDDEYPESLAKFFNFERQDLPQIRLYAGGAKFKPYHFTTRNATSTLIIDFIKDVFEGRTLHYQRVQKAPKYNDGAIKILTTNTLSEFAMTPDTANIVIYWRPKKGSVVEGVYRPALWEAVEEYRDRGLLGPGKIIFGEFNEVENEIDGEPIGIMDMVFINKQIAGEEQRETLTYSQNEILPMQPGKEHRPSTTINKAAFVAWFEHVYFSKLPGAVPKAEESKKTEDEIKSEL